MAFNYLFRCSWASQVAQVLKSLPASAGDAGDMSLISGSGRSLGVGNGNPLKYSCLRIPWTEEPGRLTDIHTDIKPPQSLYRIFLGSLKMSSCLYRQSCPLCSSQAIIYLTSATLDHFVFPKDVHWNHISSFGPSFFSLHRWPICYWRSVEK